MKTRQGLRKPHRYKIKKPLLKERFFWLGILFLIFIAAFIYFLYFSPVFQVKNILVSGQNKVSKEVIESIVKARLESKVLFLKTKSLFSINFKQIRQDILNDFPQVAEVELERGFFNSLKVLVIERQPMAVWCEGADCFFLDNQGILFEKVSEPGFYMLLKVDGVSDSLAPGDRVIGEAVISQILSLKTKLKQTLGISIEQAHLVSEQRLNMTTGEGWEIYFNLKGDLDWQMTELGLVLEKQIPPEKRGALEYIDLRFTRVYYK